MCTCVVCACACGVYLCGMCLCSVRMRVWCVVCVCVMCACACGARACLGTRVCSCGVHAFVCMHVVCVLGMVEGGRGSRFCMHIFALCWTACAAGTCDHVCYYICMLICSMCESQTCDLPSLRS